jgi:hypothetical protein
MEKQLASTTLLQRYVVLVLAEWQYPSFFSMLAVHTYVQVII